MDKKEGKILGIIGGMGPLATELFYKMIITNTKANCDQDHLNMIILNHATMPDRTEAIKKGHITEVTERLREDAQFLFNSGVCTIAVPCNTSHVMLKDVEEGLNIPIIDMIKESSMHVYEKNYTKVGIMATDGTIEIGLYAKECKSLGIELIVPDEEHQKKVMKIIYEGVKAGKPVDKADFLAVDKHFRNQGCQCVILACTELSCYKDSENLPEYYVDAMEILAKRAILLSGKELEK